MTGAHPVTVAPLVKFVFSVLQETIVSQLHTRYDQGAIYTYIGDILLAVNPFCPLPIYTDEVTLTMTKKK